MNSKQRRSIWREHQAQIESLEFQYRVLSGTKPDRGFTLDVPKYLATLQHAVKARRQLKAETGSSKGWCGADPFSNLVIGGSIFAGGQWSQAEQRALRRNKSWVSNIILPKGTVIIDEITKLDTVEYRQSLDWFKAQYMQTPDQSGVVGASAGAADTSSVSIQRALSRQGDDQVDALVYGFRAHLARNPPSL